MTGGSLAGRRLRDLMPLGSRVRYLLWRAFRSRRPITVRLSTGERLSIRPRPASDLDTACEVFLLQNYRCPRPLAPEEIRTIVDVGANVGYTCLYWRRTFPGARVLAFEPHPAHADQIARHLALNGLTADAVEVCRAAAAAHSGAAYLVSAESASRVVGRRRDDAIPIEAVDFFQRVGPGAIDLLKIDIEGGEYLLLADDRFAALSVRNLVLEWHRTPERPDGKEWCRARLEALGYQVREGDDYGDAGIVWAFRGPPGRPADAERRDAPDRPRPDADPPPGA
jgi:FkbM family methyltransferase